MMWCGDKLMLTCDVAKIVPTPQKVPIVGATNVSALLLPKPPQFRALNPHWRAVIAAACHSVPFFYALFSFPFLAAQTCVRMKC